MLGRRHFMTGLVGAGTGLGASIGAGFVGGGIAAAQARKPDPVATPNLAENARPITPAERRARIARLQDAMGQAGLGGVLIEAGSALTYFTGIKWRRSERFTGAIIPRDGDIAVVTPYFEEPSIREQMAFGDDVRTWHEDEDPFALLAGIVSDRKINAPVGIEETVRFFIADGARQAGVDVVAGARAIRSVRMRKSDAEIALMQTANDIVMAAYRLIHPRIEAGMGSADIGAMMREAISAHGGTPLFSLVLLNEASAYPHGTDTPQTVREGSVILMDCGCSVHDYQADISRTWVFGEPTKRQRDVWNTVKAGQELALETAKIGVPAGKVDQTVRSFYAEKGYGPDYETPGLSHRLGHGIGMDGHEPINFVRGETTPLAAGMCFSNEPGIYIFGEFGVRLEDCLYMSPDGPVLFSALSPSIDKPFG